MFHYSYKCNYSLWIWTSAVLVSLEVLMVNALCSLKSPSKIGILQSIVSASRDNSKEAWLQPCLRHAKNLGSQFSWYPTYTTHIIEM